MTADFEQVYQDVRAWAETQGIKVRHEKLKPEKVGAFDGLSVTMNHDYGAEERTYYLVHALGSIVRWSLSQSAVQAMFDELRAAKKNRENDAARLERAIERYRAFETESSEFAVWLLAELGHAAVVPAYTNFMRADLEALSEFHRHGQAPVWRDFFAHWNEEVAQGRRRVEPYRPKANPPSCLGVSRTRRSCKNRAATKWEVSVRRIRYQVATSLDGYIAGPKGEADWILHDPDIDFGALWDQFDTLLIGRRTFEVMTGGKKKSGATPGMKTFVFSRTLRQRDYPKVTIIAENAEETLTALRKQSGKDIWLFGGGQLFRSLLDMGLVDTVELAVVPVLLGGGISLLPPPAKQAKLKLTGHKVYQTGIVLLQYAVQ